MIKESEQPNSDCVSVTVEGASCNEETSRSCSPPKVTFTISSSPPPFDEGESRDENDLSECRGQSVSPSPEDTEDASRYWLNVTNPLLQIRRASDQGLRNARLVQHIQHLYFFSTQVLNLTM